MVLLIFITKMLLKLRFLYDLRSTTNLLDLLHHRLVKVLMFYSSSPALEV